MSELPPWDTLVGWAADGQDKVERAAADLDPGQLQGPSRLEKWSRGHVLSHLARNADAIVNLLTWARTGEESRMYSSPTDREDGILAGADRELPEQLADLIAANARFLQAAAAVPEERRSSQVISGQGRQIPAHEVPWLRAREAWLHLVDLDAGYDIDILPDAMAWTLTADVAGWMSSRVEATADLRVEATADLRVEATADLRVDGHGTIRLGPGATAGSVITGRPQRLAGWLTGRSGTSGLSATDGFPDLPRWL